MRFAVCVVCVLAACVVGMADTVETLDGTLIEGSQVFGLPDVISLDDDGVIAEVDADRILSLVLEEGAATVTTTTSERLSGASNLQIPAITVKTETRETKIPFDQVVRIAIDGRTNRQRSGNAIAILGDGRAYEGDLSRSFPEELTLESGGISTSTRVRSMTSIQFGDPVSIETASGASVGTLKTALPSSVELETQFGKYRIPAATIEELRLTSKRSVSFGTASSSTAGVGFKIWQGLPFIIGNLSLGSVGAECAIGFGSMVESGASVDVTALWYAGSVRYILLLPGIESLFRPYLGVGIVGLTAIASAGSVSASASAFGFDAGVGFDIPLEGFGIPLTLFAGTDWSFLSGAGSLVYQLGVRLDFSL